MIPSPVRRRVATRLNVEALESRCVLDATLAAAAPVLGPPRVDVPRADIPRFEVPRAVSVVIEIDSFDSFGPASSPSRSLDAPTPQGLIFNQVVSTVFEIDFGVDHSDDRNPGLELLDVMAPSFVEISYQTGLVSPSRPLGSPGASSPIESGVAIGPFLESPNSFPPTRTTPNGNTPGLEQQSTSPSAAGNAIRSEEAAVPVGSSRTDSAAVAASAAARRTDAVVAAGLPVDRRSDRPTPTAFATNLEIDALRPDIDPNRPLPSPAELTAPRFIGPAEPQESTGSADSMLLRAPIQQARDAVFAGLFVDGFAPELFDHAFRALKSVETNLESASGSGWYRMALGCWVVAAVLGYEAARQTQTATARSLRYVSASLKEPEDER
jgi:hypothetical protein